MPIQYYEILMAVKINNFMMEKLHYYSFIFIENRYFVAVLMFQFML